MNDNYEPKRTPATRIIHHKYAEGKRYTEELRLNRTYGNTNCMYVEFITNDGDVLTWETSVYNKSYKELKIRAIYSFTIQYTMYSTIFIQRVSLTKDGNN